MASFSVALILLPNDAIDYGTAGVAIIISKQTGLPLAPCVFCVFIPFIIAGYIVLGRSFTIKATMGSIAYTLGIRFFEGIPFELPIMKDIISEHAGSFSTVSTIDEILR